MNELKKFRAYYYIPKLNQEHECDVFAMSLSQAYEMYKKSSFMILIRIEDIYAN